MRTIAFYILLIAGSVLLVVGSMTIVAEKNLSNKSKNNLISMVVLGIAALGGSFFLQPKVK